MTQIILRRAPAGGIEQEQPPNQPPNQPPINRRYGGGQFIPAVMWEAEKSKAAAALGPLVDAYADRMKFLAEVYQMSRHFSHYDPSSDKLVSVVRIEGQMQDAVRENYAAAFLLGKRAAGNLMSMSKEDSANVQAIKEDEDNYLHGFMKDMYDGLGTMPYAARADMYGKAARELYWLGFVRADLTRVIRWELGATEHCTDCLRMSDKGYMSAPDLLHTGLLPQSGKLACLGYHCQCRLVRQV